MSNPLSDLLESQYMTGINSINFVLPYKYMKIKLTDKNRIPLNIPFSERRLKVKIKSLVLCFLAISLFSTAIRAQGTKASVNLQNTDLKAVVKEIEKQTDYLFVYNPSEVDLNKKTSLNVKDRPVSEILSTVFNNTNIIYRIEGNNIMLMNRSFGVNQEKKKVTGVIKDEAGEPLIGATVSLKNSTDGTISDIDGRFSIDATLGQILVVSYIGYKPFEMPVTERNIYDVNLVPDAALELDAVVVTALGIKRAQKALSYNVQEISQSDITTVKDANLINSLSGKVAGVNINTSSSGIGGASKVVMRGTKSIDRSNNALYVIDGIPMYTMGNEGSGGRGDEFGSSGTTEAIADINPEDIETISVLTGAAAAALYGNQGANGAIVITTKRGSADKLNVTFSSNAELFNPFVLPRFQNRYGTGDLAAQEGSTIRSWGNKLVPENYYGYSPKKDFFETGTAFTNSLSVSTGTDKNQTYFSAAVVNSDGIVPNNQYDRYNFTFRNTTKFLNDKITLDVGVNYILQKDQNMVNNGVYSNPISSAYLFPRGDDFDMVRVFERYDPAMGVNVQYWPQGEGDFRLQNPYWIAYRNLKNNDKKRYMFNAGLSYDVLNWLNLVGHVRVDNSHNDYTERLYASTNATLAGPNGQYLINKSDNLQVYGDILVNINKNFDDFSLVVNAGASISDLKADALQVDGKIREDGIPNFFNVFQLDRDDRRESQAGWRTQSQAIFASAELGYKSTYYLTLTGRNDWESALATTEKLSFFYPSVGLSTILSEIIKMPKQINYMKLRGSFASVGTPIPRNISITTHPWEGNVWGEPSISPIRKFKAERTNSWELGLTTRIIDHFNLDVSWYHTTTHNQTFLPKLSASSGYESIYIQTGSVRNTGLEASLRYTNQWGKLSWASNYIFSFNRNKINELVDNVVIEGQLFNIDRLDVGGLGRASFILTPGGTLGDLYSTQDLKRDSNGNIYVDNDGNISSVKIDDGIYLGSVFPKYNMSWRNDLSWNNFNLGFMLSARIGGIVYSSTQAALDFYGVSDDSAIARDNGGVVINGGDVIPARTWYNAIGASDGLPQYYTYSATNVRLQELSIGYTFPSTMLKFGSVSISAVARNLWMIYNKAPFDPEAVATTGNYFQGIDHFMVPSLRNIGFNLRVKF